MTDFYLWFTTGLQHILDLNGYDHICYIAALTVMFPPREWKKLLVLVTAFTIGHSLTLALSVLNIISVPQSLIECLIPVTIITTCVYNLSTYKNPPKGVSFIYVLALTFGFIHGMGFSYLLRSLLGREESIVGPLFSFNLGLELGQLLIVACVLLISVFLERLIRVERKHYARFVSSAVCVIAIVLLIQRINEL